MSDNKLRIGTRGSPLALTQANMVRDLLTAAYPDAPAPEIVTIRTTGDAVTDRPLAELGGKGLFTKEIDRAQLDGAIQLVQSDLAVTDVCHHVRGGSAGTVRQGWIRQIALDGKEQHARRHKTEEHGQCNV